MIGKESIVIFSKNILFNILNKKYMNKFINILLYDMNDM